MRGVLVLCVVLVSVPSIAQQPPNCAVGGFVISPDETIWVCKGLGVSPAQIPVGGAATWGAITGTLVDQTDLDTALDAKQATLVSGTNIKTINGSTVLGSGDLVVGGAVAWGGVTGTLSDQTDLQTALDAKAAKSANLSDLANAATAFGNIKQAATTTATGVVELATDGESAANVVVQGNDARMSNARTPTAHASTHLSNGSDAMAAATTTVRGTVELATDGESAASLVPQANDSRLSNARTPTAHASTHLDNGSDPIAVFTSTRTGVVPASGGGTTNFLRADGSFAAPPGGGSGPVTMRVASDQTSTSTSFANVGGLTTSVNASTTYSYRCNLLWSSSAATEGGNFAVNGPASTAIRIWRVVYTSATAHTSATDTAFDTGTLLTAGPGSAFWPVELYGTFTVSGSGGTFAVRWRAESGGANSMTIRAGSFCQVY